MTLEQQNPNLFRMPAGFGPTPGPRQLPDGSRRADSVDSTRATAWVTARADLAALTELLPNGFHPRGPASLTISFSSLRNLEWLAGRGYNLVDVSCPVTYETDGGSVDGHFVFVLWENLADPIISGREEVGFNKLYAEVTDVELEDSAKNSDRVDLAASWDGFEFLRLSVDSMDSVDPSPAQALPRFHHKYVPSTGNWGRADADYIVSTPAAAPTVRVTKSFTGRGSVDFTRATFDQLPTLLHVVNGLESLGLGDAVASGAQLSVGAKTLIDQERKDA